MMVKVYFDNDSGWTRFAGEPWEHEDDCHEIPESLMVAYEASRNAMRAIAALIENEDPRE
jgi:hypothetical protein